MNLFVFFALPLATILFAIVLQKILRSPILVASTFFAVGLIVSFVAFSDTLAEALIATIIYTIIAYITAIIVMMICRCKRRFCCNSNNNSMNLQDKLFESQQTFPIQTLYRQRRCLSGDNCGCNDDNNNNNNSSGNNNLLRISCRCGNSDQTSDLLSVDSTCSANNLENNNGAAEIINDSMRMSDTGMTTDNRINTNSTYGDCRNAMTNRYYNMKRRGYRRW